MNRTQRVRKDTFKNSDSSVSTMSGHVVRRTKETRSHRCPAQARAWDARGGGCRDGENIQERENNRTKCTQSSYVDFRFAIPEEVARIEIGGIEREMATM